MFRFSSVVVVVSYTCVRVLFWDTADGVVFRLSSVVLVFSFTGVGVASKDTNVCVWVGGWVGVFVCVLSLIHISEPTRQS